MKLCLSLSSYIDKNQYIPSLSLNSHVVIYYSLGTRFKRPSQIALSTAHPGPRTYHSSRLELKYSCCVDHRRSVANVYQSEVHVSLRE